MILTSLQEKVLEKARENLKDKDWFCGVCLNAFHELTDKRINEIGIDRAVEEVEFDTAFYDDPTIWG